VEANENFWKMEESEMNENSTRRESATESRVFRLYRCEPGLCNGSNTCNGGRVGVACGRCPENHARDARGCMECNMTRDPQELNKWRAVFGVVAGLLASVVWFSFGWAPLFGGTAQSFFVAWFAWCVVYVVIRESRFFGVPDPYLSCPVCVSRPIRIFNRTKLVVEKGKQLAEKGKEAKDFFSDPKNLKLFQQYLKASANLRAYLRSSS